MTKFQEISFAREIDRLADIAGEEKDDFYSKIKEIYEYIAARTSFGPLEDKGTNDPHLSDEMRILEGMLEDLNFSKNSREFLENLYTIAEQDGIAYGSGDDSRYKNTTEFFNERIKN